MIPPSRLKDLAAEQVRNFLSSSLTPGCRIEPDGKTFRLVKGTEQGPFSKTSLQALAAALVMALDGARDVSYEDLWRHAARTRVDVLSDSGRRKYAETLRNDWDEILRAFGPLPAGHLASMPSSTERIPLAMLFPPFDRTRALNALHKLAPPRLDVQHDGKPKPPIHLDVLEANEWKVVGHSRSPEPLGKIGLDYDIHLSRQAFEIRLEGHALHVRAIREVTNMPIFRDQPSPAFVLHNGDEFRVGKLTFRFQGATGESDTATPRYANPPRRHEFE